MFHHKPLTLALQLLDKELNELHDYCKRRNWSNVTEYRDVISGAKFSRQGLDHFMTNVRRGRLDAIVCFTLDRLGGSLPHLAQIV